MFIGHFAAGFATKKMSNSLSLVIMFIAVQFLDLLWPILVPSPGALTSSGYLLFGLGG
jgi:hypothetical protein